jgi:ribosomal protein S18 acetylase RimI-like enzyme
VRDRHKIDAGSHEGRAVAKEIGGSAGDARDTIADVTPLDNPVWHALAGPQAQFAQGAELALRYEPDVSVFCAIPDAPTPDAWDALRTLVGPGGVALLARINVDPPHGWEELYRGAGHQLIAPPHLGTASNRHHFSKLTTADATDMLDLVARTKPGPFAKRTVELGSYVGARDDSGALVAMAGVRMQLGDFTEISAVCTDTAHRGRGLATALLHTVAAIIRARGEQPFLHTATDNTTAIALYERLGFTRRATLPVVGLRAPG